MAGPVLSTMWAQQERFDTDVPAFARIAKLAGFTGIEVSHSTGGPSLQALLDDGTLPLPSLHAPCPRMPARRGGLNTSLNLASLDDDERREAVDHHRRTIAFAERCGARFVVVHLGGLARPLAAETALRSLFHAGRMDSPEAGAAIAEAHERRAALAPAYLDAARCSLAELVAVAAPLAITLGLENRLHFHEIPSADETELLLADYATREAGYWHDTGHAEVQHRLGLIDAPLTLSRLAPNLVGSHLHDVRGIVDHRAPGNGDVDWGYIAAALPADLPRTLEIDQREPEPLLARAIAVLRGNGVLHDMG